MNPKPALKQAWVSGVFFAVLLPYVVLAEPSGPSHWPAEAIVRFDATSTLHDFGGTVHAQPFMLQVSSNRWSAEGDVLSGMMNTASAKRDQNMHEMFKTNDYPRIHGKVAQAAVPASGTTNATLSLKIRDQEHDLPVVVSAWSETDSNVTFRAEWDVSLKQFKLNPPSVLGVIRVGDVVHLSADVSASKTAALTNSAPGLIVLPDK
jgi:polyisoprenoid-binding protein YceI